MVALLQPVFDDSARGMALVQVAETLVSREALTRKLMIDTLARQLLLVALAALVIAIVVRVAFRPLGRLRAELDAPPEERMSAWAAFWRARDPTPLTETNEVFGEFLERLRYALEHYSRSEPGFRTDRGRIYIENGPPDRIETRSEAGARSYELWFYTRKGIVYIFEDAIGGDDYRLLTTRIL